jgi:hypothetical protein
LKNTGRAAARPVFLPLFRNEIEMLLTVPAQDDPKDRPA